MTKYTAIPVSRELFERLQDDRAKDADRIGALEAELAALQHATRGQTFQTPDEKDVRIGKLEAALQLIGNELSLHADKGPAGEAFRSLLNPTLPETSGQRPGGENG